MEPRWRIGLGFSLAATLSFGCAGVTAQAGLSSVPSLNQQSADQDSPYDVIANGADSAQREPKVGDDRAVSPMWTAHDAGLQYARLGDVWPHKRFCYNYGVRGRCLDVGFVGSRRSVVWSHGFGGTDPSVVSTKARSVPLW